MQHRKLSTTRIHFVNAGTGKGVAIYAKPQFTHVEDIQNATYHISAFESKTTTVISVYRSEATNQQALLNHIINICSTTDPRKMCIIGADFNIWLL